MRKRGPIAAGVLAVLALVLATSGVGVGSPAVAASTTINYWGFSGGVTSATAKMVISNFETSHPGYAVNAVVMNTSDFDVKLPSVLGKSSGPDLVYTGTEPNHLGRFVQVGQVSSLKADWAARGWNKLVPSTQMRVTYNGQPYAVGNELETLGLMYNKKIFARLGLAVPTTLEDMVATMSKIRQKDPSITPLDLACGGPCYSGLHMMHALGYAIIPTKLVVATTPNGNGNYTDPSWLKMLTTFQAWNKAGYFTRDASGIPDENHWASFCAGKTAMYASGPWDFATMAQCEKDNPGGFSFGFTGFPVANGLPFQAYVGTGKAWFLSKSLDSNPAKRKAVLDLVAAMTAPATFKSWIETDLLIPAVQFSPSDYVLSTPEKAALKIMNAAGKNGGPVDIGFNNSAAETDVWVAGLQGILSGSTTPQQLINKLQAQLQRDRKAWQTAK